MLDSPMALLYWISGTRPNLVLGILAQFFLNCPWVGGQAIGGDLIWSILMKTDGLGEEGFGPSHIACLAEANIDQVAIFINASIQVAPHAFYPNIRFVNHPDLAHFALPLHSDLLSKMGQESFFPVPYGLVGELEASHQEELGHITIAELVADATKQHLKNDIGMYLDEVERRAAAFIISSTAGLAAEHVVAQVGFPLER